MYHLTLKNELSNLKRNIMYVSRETHQTLQHDTQQQHS